MKYRLLVVLFFIAFSVFCVSVRSAAEETQRPSVLVIHSYSEDYPWTAGITAGLKSVLTDGDENVLPVVHYDYLDTKTHYSPEYLDLMYRAYRLKYAGKHYDVVITCDDAAYVFAKTYYNDLFPGSAVVFCGLNYYEPSYLNGLPSATGVVETYDVDDTLEFALYIHPNARRIFVINDDSPTGAANLKHFKESIAGIANSVVIEYSDPSRPLSETLAKLETFTNDTIVFVMHQLVDSDGRMYSIEESSRFLREHARSPIYSVWEYYIGKCAVGGKILSGFDQGAAAARLAVRILGGENASSIPVITESFNKYVFDYNYLRKWHIPVSILPQGSVVVNRPEPLHWIAVTLGIVALFFIVLSALLLYNRNMHIRVRKDYLHSEERYRRLAEAAFEGIFIQKDGVILDANERMFYILGYKPEELIGTSIFDRVDPEYRDRAIRYSQDKSSIPIELRFVHKDGRKLWVETCGKNIYFQGIEARVVALHDITELKKSGDSVKLLFVFEKTASTILSHFIEVTDVDKAVNISLGDLGKFSGADRVHLSLFTGGGGSADVTHEWCAPGIEAQIDSLKNLPCNRESWIYQALERGEAVVVENLADVDACAFPKSSIIVKQTNKSMSLVPIRLRGQTIGFLSMDNTHATGRFSEESLALARLFSEVLGKIFAREK